MMDWTKENKQRLLDIVLNAPAKEAALKKAAEEFGISFYSVRNQYYTILAERPQIEGYVRKNSSRKENVILSPKKRQYKKNKGTEQLSVITSENTANKDAEVVIADPSPITKQGQEPIEITLATELKPTSLDDTLIVLANAVAKEIQTYRKQISELKAKNNELTQKAETESKDFSAFEEMIAAEEKKSKELQEEISKLTQEVTLWKSKYKTLEDDYNVISRVIRLARDMTAQEELGNRPKETFKMESNGNLERLRPKNSFWNDDELEPGAIVL